jgi:hypothetical protein
MTSGYTLQSYTHGSLRAGNIALLRYARGGILTFNGLRTAVEYHYSSDIWETGKAWLGAATQ